MSLLFWTFKLRICTKLNCLKKEVFWYWNCVLMLNWNSWIKLFWHLNYVLKQYWSIWNKTVLTFNSFPVAWGFIILRLYLCRGVIRLPNECQWYDTKNSHGEVQVMLELWGMQSTTSLESLSVPLWPGIAAPDRPFMYIK